MDQHQSAKEGGNKLHIGPRGGKYVWIKKSNGQKKKLYVK